MRLSKLKYILSLLEQNNLITADQNNHIFNFMKERQKTQLFRFVRWCFILGAFWIFFGFMALIQLLNFHFLIDIWNYLLLLTKPFFELMETIFGSHYDFVVNGAVLIVVWALFFWLGNRVRNRESLPDFKLEYFHDSRLRSGTVFLVMGYIAAGIGLSLLNRVLLPENVSYYDSMDKFFPLFYVVGVFFFGYCAYRLKDQIALLFGIHFIALSVGCYSGYGHACYFLAVSRPVIQLIVAVVLILTGFMHVRNHANGWQEEFGRTYQWTGLLLGFFALWIMSIWGISKPEGYRWEPQTMELWFANIVFILTTIGCMIFGAQKEERTFFNYGLTFLIIETYTIFFSHLWKSLHVAYASLLLGCLLVGTGYLLRHIWLLKQRLTAI